MDHYNKGGEANPFLDGGIEPLALSEEEIDDLVAFLFTLTDERFADAEPAACSTSSAPRRRAAPVPRRGPGHAQDAAVRAACDWASRSRQGESHETAAIKSIETKLPWRSASELFRQLREPRPPRLPQGVGGGGGRGRRPAACAPALASSRRRRRTGATDAGAGLPLRLHLGLASLRAQASTTASCAAAARGRRRQRLDPQPDFVLYGGDLAQLGAAERARARRADPQERSRRRCSMMVGEHDWYSRPGREVAGAVRPADATRSTTRACTSSCSTAWSRRTSGPRAA